MKVSEVTEYAQRIGVENNFHRKHQLFFPNQLNGPYEILMVLTKLDIFLINPLNANPTEWSNILKKIVGFCRRIV